MTLYHPDPVFILPNYISLIAEPLRNSGYGTSIENLLLQQQTGRATLITVERLLLAALHSLLVDKAGWVVMAE
jgi:hypothetical protein